MALVKARTKGMCACHCGQRIAVGPIGFHHVFPKARWPELADTPENVVGVAASCHAGHELASRRLPRRAVRVAEPLAHSHAMRSYFARTYPV